MADTALQRQNELQDYANLDAPTESDDEADSSSAIFDSFNTSGGSKAIGNMINFSPRQFHASWFEMSDHVTAKWNVRRGRKSNYTGKDVLFMILANVKHGGQWDWTF